jgi:PPE-repeat protein
MAASTAAAAAAQASTRERSRARRRQHRGLADHSDEYMDLDQNLGAPPGDAATQTSASAHGAGPLGFTGTARSARGDRAAGFTTLQDDEFGSGPKEPMLPGSWREEDGQR